MVIASVFMIARCSSLFEYPHTALIVITFAGAMTSFLAATTGILQNDRKRVIAYSTCSQLGYMIFACGISNYAIGTLTTKEAKKAIHRKIWRRSLNSVVNKICKSVVPIWKRINRIANSIKTNPSKFGQLSLTDQLYYRKKKEVDRNEIRLSAIFDSDLILGDEVDWEEKSPFFEGNTELALSYPMGNFKVHPLAAQAVQYFLSSILVYRSFPAGQGACVTNWLDSSSKEVNGGQVCLWLEKKSNES
ncbi:hypothetical protein L1987_23831 [Smallanthus sonchifolius]|uniref:Uncharacterized protein n=1 Tax=Smallanthus sonchifolius TaxID=185202 RepID=A0ACB9IK90_9ASTR|nr:hypothetical protein L1987_23831 [Smallanthus sonchifolius]